jgi:hypothetical protein
MGAPSGGPLSCDPDDDDDDFASNEHDPNAEA